jgi:hypothetical protein
MTAKDVIEQLRELKLHCESMTEGADNWQMDICALKYAIDAVKETAEKKYALWSNKGKTSYGESVYGCSECRFEVVEACNRSAKKSYRFCPSCGAEMLNCDKYEKGSEQ